MGCEDQILFVRLTRVTKNRFLLVDEQQRLVVLATLVVGLRERRIGVSRDVGLVAEREGGCSVIFVGILIYSDN